MRVVSNPAFSRDAVTPREAAGLLAASTASSDHRCSPDELPFVLAADLAGSRLVGHQQVTDAYLLGLAHKRGARLATLDAGLEALVPARSPERRALEIIR